MSLRVSVVVRRAWQSIRPIPAARSCQICTREACSVPKSTTPAKPAHVHNDMQRQINRKSKYRLKSQEHLKNGLYRALPHLEERQSVLEVRTQHLKDRVQEINMQQVYALGICSYMKIKESTRLPHLNLQPSRARLPVASLEITGAVVGVPQHRQQNQHWCNGELVAMHRDTQAVTRNVGTWLRNPWF